ncbi:hypothetical protein [Pseudactinotalea sp.]|uniref:hypothetical protein n=1 Tax=Pseudactinotalea sp. TaxID=1926260 RepID=UPI003B3B775E
MTLARTSAAAIPGLSVWDLPDVPHVIQEHNPSSRAATDINRSVALLPDDDVTEAHGCRVTVILRTILDCARFEHPRDALVVADSGLRAIVRPRRRDSRDAVEERARPIRETLLARIVDGSRGAAQARAVIRASNPYAESAPESVVRWIAISRGMPTPILQLPVQTARGTFYTDAAWRRLGTSPTRWQHVEFDGAIKYRKDPAGRLPADVVIAERRREAAITGTGDWVIRIYPDEIDDEDRVFGKLTSKLNPRTVAAWQPDPDLFRLPGT